MSKSEQKRICIQSKCAVRDELREQLDFKDKDIQLLAKKLTLTLNAFEQLINDVKEKHPFCRADSLMKYINEHKNYAKQYLKEG